MNFKPITKLVIKIFPQVITNKLDSVEASRHRGPRDLQMDTPFQLKMIPASINLQKTSGHVVRTHHPMVLLAFSLVINLLFLLSKKAYPLSSHEAPFYSVRSSVLFNGGKTFWLVMMALR